MQGRLYMRVCDRLWRCYTYFVSVKSFLYIVCIVEVNGVCTIQMVKYIVFLFLDMFVRNDEYSDAYYIPLYTNFLIAFFADLNCMIKMNKK